MEGWRLLWVQSLSQSLSLSLLVGSSVIKGLDRFVEHEDRRKEFAEGRRSYLSTHFRPKYCP